MRESVAAVGVVFGMLGALGACGGGDAVPTSSAASSVGVSSAESASSAGGAAGVGGAGAGHGHAGGGGGAGGAGGIVEPFEPLPAVSGIAELEDLNPDPHVLEVNLTARAHDAQITDGPATPMLNYNDLFPGPLLHARVGDRVIVHFKNDLAEATTVHWHGLRISDVMDGSPRIQDPVEPGESFTYDFVVPDAGTYWYHTHLHQIEQLERGLYGAIVVHERVGETPVFSAERVFMGDDVRLTAGNAIAPFKTSGPDVGMGRVGNTFVVNGKAGPVALEIPKGAVERWRFVLATNALSYGLRLKGAKTRVIATDGGLLPARWDTDRVEVAPGQRYEFEVRPDEGATEVRLEALVLQLGDNGQPVEVPFPIAVAKVVGEVSTPEPTYPVVTLPDATATPARELTWQLSGAAKPGGVEFTINGVATSQDSHDHVVIETFTPNEPVAITVKSNVSPAHPFHVHGQFFQIVARGGKPVVDEPGLRDTVHVRGQQSVTFLSFFENPGRWMVHCHIGEHSERGMMADIQVGEPGDHAMAHGE